MKVDFSKFLILLSWNPRVVIFRICEKREKVHKWQITNLSKYMLLCFSFLLFVSLHLHADPADSSYIQKITLADGHKTAVRLVGDEYYNCWQSVETGNLYLRSRKGELTPLSRSGFISKRKSALKEQLSNTVSRVSAPVIGKKKQLIILAEFSDVPFTAGTNSFFKDFFNKRGFSYGEFNGSVRDYFLAQSNGQLDLSFDVVGPVRLSRSYTYYGYRTDGKGLGDHVRDMIAESLTLADSKVDYSLYDWDGDGVVEQVGIMYSGLARNIGGDDYTIWPHKSGITPLYLDGVMLSSYCCQSELQKVNNTDMINGIGTFCHEFSHCLGLPDTYDGASENPFYGLRTWDVMSGGNHNNHRFTPSGYTALGKYLLGWQQPEELTKDTHVNSLLPMSQNGKFYRIKNDAYPDEFFFLEYRKKEGWDEYIPGTGLLITHVDYDEDVFSRMAPNSSEKFDHEHYKVMQADGYAESLTGDVYPWDGNNSFSNNSYPSTELYHKNIDGSYFLNKEVYNICFNGENAMSFDFKNNNISEFYSISVIDSVLHYVPDNSVEFSITVHNNSYIAYDKLLRCELFENGKLLETVNSEKMDLSPQSDGVAQFLFSGLSEGKEYELRVYHLVGSYRYEWTCFKENVRFSLDDLKSYKIITSDYSFTQTGSGEMRLTVTLFNYSYLPYKNVVSAYVREDPDIEDRWITSTNLYPDLGPYEKKTYDYVLTDLKDDQFYNVYIYYVLDGKWKQCGSSVRFHVSSNPSQSGIDVLKQEKTSEKYWYNLNGQRIESSLSRLPSGIYIMKGKKVFLP